MHVQERRRLPGLTPQVLTDYIELSIGGTLTVRGVGARTLRYDLRSDDVVKPEVLTGTDGRCVS